MTTPLPNVTKRQAKTLNRHIARLKNGEGVVIGTEKGGAGTITIVRLKSTKPGNTDHIYGIKKANGKSGESGVHPRNPLFTKNYDSDSDSD